MPLSNAKKQRRYREKLKDNLENKEKEPGQNLKKAKKVKEMIEEEKNKKRIMWQNQKRKQKEKRKET
jgi:DNA-directed RNA polymerase subunit M/transcription elongation factor TFIIS